MIILVDQDGVLADFTAAFHQAVEMVPHLKGYYHPDRQFTFDLEDSFPEPLRQVVTELYHNEGFFRDLPMVPGARDALYEMRDRGHSVFICTTPLKRYHNCVLEKYEWVEKHLGADWALQMIPTRDKTIIQGDILIDDKPVITGVGAPTWKHYVFDAPYNRVSQDGRVRMTWNNWKDVIQGI